MDQWDSFMPEAFAKGPDAFPNLPQINDTHVRMEQKWRSLEQNLCHDPLFKAGNIFNQTVTQYLRLYADILRG